MPRTTDTDEAERLRAAGQRHRAIRDYLRAAGRTLPLPGVGTLTLCGEEG
jgi:hypothetical protein